MSKLRTHIFYGRQYVAIEDYRELERRIAPEATALMSIIDRLEVYGHPSWPAGVTFAVTGVGGQFASAREAVDAALSRQPQSRLSEENK